MDRSVSESSVKSFSSDQLEDEFVVDDDLEYDIAPYDVFGEHESIGQILVAKKGDALPLTTKYKRKDSNSVPVKFHVTRMLDVIPIEFEPKVKVVEKIAVIWAKY